MSTQDEEMVKILSRQAQKKALSGDSAGYERVHVVMDALLDDINRTGNSEESR